MWLWWLTSVQISSAVYRAEIMPDALYTSAHLLYPCTSTPAGGRVIQFTYFPLCRWYMSHPTNLIYWTWQLWLGRDWPHTWQEWYPKQRMCYCRELFVGGMSLSPAFLCKQSCLALFSLSTFILVILIIHQHYKSLDCKKNFFWCLHWWTQGRYHIVRHTAQWPPFPFFSSPGKPEWCTLWAPGK